MEQVYVYFQAGTLVLEGVGKAMAPAGSFQWLNGRWRCPAGHYPRLQVWLKQRQIHDKVGQWPPLYLVCHEQRQAHDYQTESLAAWHNQNRFGSIVLPTGAGKTFVAIQAISQCQVSTLIVVPTIDLLHQWYARLQNAFQTEIGVWYGQEKESRPVTITTYSSAWSHAEKLGNQFKLLIFDEIHHLPAPTWHEIALMYAAPFRLGLTATYPQNSDNLALLEELVGPVLYRKHIEDLSGEQLAQYRTERLRIDLNEAERAAYDTAYAAYTGYVREAGLRERHGGDWWEAFTRRSAFEREARRAKVAELKLKEIVHQAQAKLTILDRLLREHADQPMLIFTTHNRFAYQIARHYLIPAITHQTKAAERKEILEGFQAGRYRAIVTSKVLNEGIDVPEAKVAVVLGGSASAREYVQRLGRILRKKGNLQAILYEVIARKTVDERVAQQRKQGVQYHVSGRE